MRRQRRRSAGSSRAGGVSSFSSGARSTPGATIASIASSTSAESTVSAAASCESQVVHRAGADDRAGHGRVRGDESERELDHASGRPRRRPWPAARRHRAWPGWRGWRVSKRCGINVERLVVISRPSRTAPDSQPEASGLHASTPMSVLLGHGQDVGLDPALQDRVAGLLGDVAAQVMFAGGPLRPARCGTRGTSRSRSSGSCPRAADRSAPTASPRRWWSGPSGGSGRDRHGRRRAGAGCCPAR